MTLATLLKTLKSNRLSVDRALVELAYEFAEAAHRGQQRLSGEPYISHPLRVAVTLAELKLDEATIIAGLLHDVPEETGTSIAAIEKEFGREVATLVAGVTKLGKLKYRGLQRYIESLRKMFVAMAKDIRVILIKFADRIHNLETLRALPKRKQLRIALESLEIYAPIANRLGMGEMKGRLEDLAFPFVYPAESRRIIRLVNQAAPATAKTLKQVDQAIRRAVAQAGIQVLDIHGRQKHLYSLFLKLQKKNSDISRIYDLVALRIIVPSIQDCYTVLGLIHSLWRPLKGRIKDYIAQPKPNGYQSLHTTVFGPHGQVAEIQIRTPDMHQHAEYGIAAHWGYDDSKQHHDLPKERLSWLQELRQWQREASATQGDFLKSLKLDVFQNRIFVFTPKGDVIELPEESTPIDFAYAIHSDIGNRASVAKVNEAVEKLDYQLKSGDVVEIIADRRRTRPSKDWLRFVKTRHARQRIRQFTK